MPKNFPEIWEGRVRQTLEGGSEASFLEGVTELDGEVTQMGEENVIHIPATQFNPEVLINNKTYPLALQEYDDQTIIVKLDKYQTKPSVVTDDQIVGANYDKIDAVTKAQTNSIASKKYKKAIHAIAPDQHSATTPVLSIKANKCSYEDLVALKAQCDQLEWPEQGRRLVLSTKHFNELLLDRKNFGDLLVNYQQGKVSPVIAGFEIKTYIATPTYSQNGEKKAFGGAVEETDKTASVAFVVSNIAKKTGLTKQYFSEAKNNPENQRNLLAYRHYFIATPVEKKFIAALIDAEQEKNTDQQTD